MEWFFHVHWSPEVYYHCFLYLGSVMFFSPSFTKAWIVSIKMFFVVVRTICKVLMNTICESSRLTISSSNHSLKHFRIKNFFLWKKILLQVFFKLILVEFYNLVSIRWNIGPISIPFGDLSLTIKQNETMVSKKLSLVSRLRLQRSSIVDLAISSHECILVNISYKSVNLRISFLFIFWKVH